MLLGALLAVVSGLAALVVYMVWLLNQRKPVFYKHLGIARDTINAIKDAILFPSDQVDKELKRDIEAGLRLRVIEVLLPAGEEWRIEEMKDHRNELRAELGRVPRFHYMRLFLSTLELRWEARAYPERRID